MFDLGGLEILIIGIVALLVMGDDFPTMFRKAGQFTGKMRKMAREFSRAMEEAADDAGVKDVTNTLKTAASPKKMGLDTLNKAAESFEKWEAGAGSKRTAPPDASKDAAADGQASDLRARAGAAMSKAAMAARDAASGTSDTTAEPAASRRTNGSAKPATRKAPAKKSTAKTSAAKKPAAKKSATKTPAAKTPAKKAAAKSAKTAGEGA
ncbi:MAG: twin-arginine translocase subunit TatB [Pseudomonadota bacterium]